MPLILRCLVNKMMSCVSECASTIEYSLEHVFRIRHSNLTLRLLGCLGSSALLTQVILYKTMIELSIISHKEFHWFYLILI
jgi:hypothetical protein